MRVTALSLAGVSMHSIDRYCTDTAVLLKNTGARLAVLPAYSSLLLGLHTGILEGGNDFTSACRFYLRNSGSWNERFLELHSSMARQAGLYLAAGTIFENKAGRNYHTACCFDPSGSICCRQRQTHLTRFEHALGLNRADKLEVLKIGDRQVGLLVGNDVRHPEVGRIFAFLGADILVHSGAVDSHLYCWPQAAGLWAQVQQNQLWGVEAQLCGSVADLTFGAGSAVLGPCEITTGLSGYLARGYPQSPAVTAELDEELLLQIRQKYPILSLLNPSAYDDLLA